MTMGVGKIFSRGGDSAGYFQVLTKSIFPGGVRPW